MFIQSKLYSLDIVINFIYFLINVYDACRSLRLVSFVKIQNLMTKKMKSAYTKVKEIPPKSPLIPPKFYFASQYVQLTLKLSKQ